MERLIHKENDGDLTCHARDFDKIFSRLYAYEETGLTPEQVSKLQAGLEQVKRDRDVTFKCLCDAADIINDYVSKYGYDFDIKMNILQSHGESRVIVLPRTVGDRTYVVIDDIDCPYVSSDPVFAVTKKGVFVCEDDPYLYQWEDFGKTVFLTREEAEEALRKKEE